MEKPDATLWLMPPLPSPLYIAKKKKNPISIRPYCLLLITNVLYFQTPSILLLCLDGLEISVYFPSLDYFVSYYSPILHTCYGTYSVERKDPVT